jgi:hypothetical protein
MKGIISDLDDIRWNWQQKGHTTQGRVTFELVSVNDNIQIIVTVRPPWTFMVKTAIFLSDEVKQMKEWLEKMAQDYWALFEENVNNDPSVNQ